MEVRTKVGSNLLICSTNLDEDYAANTLIQTRKALLEPASSINGTTGSFFYTLDATARGNKANLTTGSGAVPYVQYGEDTGMANAIAGKPKYDIQFNREYDRLASGATFNSSNVFLSGASQDGAAYGYVDYTFYLKAEAEADDQAIVMTECDLKYNGGELNQSGTAGVNIDRAWRVAVFAGTVTGDTGLVSTDVAANASGQKGLLRLANAEYFDSEKAVNSTTTKDTVVNNATTTNGVVIASGLTATSTSYYKVTVRLWLEGEDDTCNTKTYAQLTNDWSLDLAFELVESGVIDTKAVDNLSNNGFTVDTRNTKTGNDYDT